MADVVTRFKEELLYQRSEGLLTDDGMQLAAFSFADRALLQRGRSMQLPFQALEKLDTLDAIGRFVDRMLQQSSTAYLPNCRRLVGSFFLAETKHWLSFEAPLPGADHDKVCRTLTLYDSLRMPGREGAFVCWPELTPSDAHWRALTGDDHRVRLRACLGDFASEAELLAAVNEETQKLICRLVLFLEMYNHRVGLMQQAPAQPEDMARMSLAQLATPDLKRRRRYLVHVTGYGTQQQNGLDCGVYALAHREEVVCPESTRDPASGGPTDVVHCVSLPKHAEQRGCKPGFARNLQILYRPQLEQSATRLAVGFEQECFQCPQAVRPPAVDGRRYRATLLRTVVDTSYLASLVHQPIYAVVKALQWLLTELVCPRRHTYRTCGPVSHMFGGANQSPGAGAPMPSAVRGVRWNLILATGSDRTDKFWADQLTYLLELHGLSDYWALVNLQDSLYGPSLDVSTQQYDYNTPADPELRGAPLFVSIAHMSSDMAGVAQNHFFNLAYLRYWLALNERDVVGPAAQPRAHFTFLNAVQQRHLGCGSCAQCRDGIGCGQVPAYLAQSQVDWTIQLGSTLEPPAGSVPRFFETGLTPPLTRREDAYLFVENDAVSLAQQQFIEIKDGVTAGADLGQMLGQTRFHTVGWDPAWASERFELAGRAK